MIAYLAVIKDCFRQAKASVSLRAVLVVVTLGLLALAPVGTQEHLTIGIRPDDVFDWGALIEQVRTEGRESRKTAAHRVWTLLDQRTRRRLLEFGKLRNEQDPTNLEIVGEFAARLDDLSRRRDFYDPDAFRGLRPPMEAVQILQAERESLSDEEMSRLNRVLLEAAFPGNVRKSPPGSISLTYFVWDPLEHFPTTEQRFLDGVRETVNFSLTWVFGTLGVFGGILLTAPIIPRTFEPGSLNLLLSKPVSRSLLFLSKFFGGCSFILIYATYLAVGIWLILGLRLGIWSHRILFFVPVLMFTFVIYYSVSAVAGLIWRNTIVCIAASMLFWLLCFTVGTTRYTLKSEYVDKARVSRILPGSGGMLMFDGWKETHVWDEAMSEWKLCFVSQENLELGPLRARVIAQNKAFHGPVLDRRNGTLFSLEEAFFRRRTFVHWGRAADGWSNRQGPAVSKGIVELLVDDAGEPLIVTTDGLYHIAGDLSAGSGGAAGRFSSALEWLSVIPLLARGGRDPLRRLDRQEDWPVLTPPWAAAVEQGGDGLAVYGDGAIRLFRRVEREQAPEQAREQEYELVGEVEIDREPSPEVVMGFGGDTLLVGLDDGELWDVDARTLETRGKHRPAGKFAARSVAASPDGRRFAVVFANGELWTTPPGDASGSSAVARVAVRGQGDISTACYDQDGHLLVADRITRVTEYDAEGKARRTLAPPMNTLQRAYYYAILPVYNLFPKPGELDKTRNYLTGGASAVGADFDPWQPVWSSLAFTVVLLAIGCVYFERQQF